MEKLWKCSRLLKVKQTAGLCGGYRTTVGFLLFKPSLESFPTHGVRLKALTLDQIHNHPPITLLKNNKQLGSVGREE